MATAKKASKTIQVQLAEAIQSFYEDSIIKKIDKDHFLDIHIPGINDKKGTHLFFNTSKNEIKIGFYCRDENFINTVIEREFNSIEAASNGLRISGNPKFGNVNMAVDAALNFLSGISDNKFFVTNQKSKIEFEEVTIDEYKKIVSQDKKNKLDSKEEDSVAAFYKAIENFKNNKLDQVSKYVESGNPLLQFSNDDEVIDNYLISMVSGGNLTQSRLDQYLAKGLDIDATTSDDDRYTACHFAAWDGNYEMLSMLIDAGANPDLVGGDTMTPLNLASSNGHLDCVKLLISHNVNLDNRVLQGNIYHSVNGGTALRDSLLNLIWDVADELINSGASISVLNENCLNGDDFIEVLKQFSKDSEDSEYNLSRLQVIINLVLGSQTKLGELPEEDILEENDIETDFQLEDFDVFEETVIDFISNKIHKGKYLTNLLYVNKALEKNGFEVDNHQAYFFDSDVLISDRELSGFLVVNMDGFYSNCISEDELNMLISWDAVTNIVYSETDNDSSIDIITDQGELTIKKINSFSLKILNTFYISLWKEIIKNFKDEPYINWNEVWQLGITEIGFNTIHEYKDFKIK